MLALHSSKRLALVGLCAAALALVPTMALAQDDPPPEAGRISYISGNVSIQPVSSDEWGQASPNLPVGPGDRIFTDSDGRAEIQVGQTYVRIGSNSDVTLVDDSQFNINFGVAQGSIRLHSFRLWPRQLLDISTPSGNAEFANSGDLRVDVLPNDGVTIFTNLGQFADITAAGDFRQELDYGQSLELAGSNPVSPQWLQPAGPDDLDYWSQQRDHQLAGIVSFQYVSPDIPGAADLDAYGDWQPQTEYGAIWYPRDVPADWQPYHYGHWISRDPWGWVWVEDESWGYAPFHYGRWINYNGRWGWVPGPVNVRPVWSPALVVFAGGVHSGGGVGLSIWFPLGPGEAYRPWYHCSPRYIDQVNITNIRESPRVHVQNTYVNTVNVTNITYINQTRGSTAMRQDDFASGRSVRTGAVRVDPREMQQARPISQPEVAPTPRAFVTRPVARPVPVSIQRPVLINQQGRQIAARPGSTPVAAPVRPAPPMKPLPGRTVVAAPGHPVQNRPGGNQFPSAQGNQEQKPNAPNPPYPGSGPRAYPVGPAREMERPINPQTGNPQENPNYQQPVRPNQPNYQQPARQDYQQPNQPNHQQQGRPSPPPVTQERPINPQTGNPQENPNYQQPVRPNQPNDQQPARRDYQKPNQPNDQQQSRPTPPPVTQERPTQPPPPNRSAEEPKVKQESGPQQQSKPNDAPKQNSNKDQKKNDKKDDKKDDKKHD